MMYILNLIFFVFHSVSIYLCLQSSSKRSADSKSSSSSDASENVSKSASKSHSKHSHSNNTAVTKSSTIKPHKPNFDDSDDDDEEENEQTQHKQHHTTTSLPNKKRSVDSEEKTTSSTTTAEPKAKKQRTKREPTTNFTSDMTVLDLDPSQTHFVHSLHSPFFFLKTMFSNTYIGKKKRPISSLPGHDEHPTQKWTDEEDKLLEKLREEGKTHQQMAEALGRTKKSVDYRSKLKISTLF